MASIHKINGEKVNYKIIFVILFTALLYFILKAFTFKQNICNANKNAVKVHHAHVFKVNRFFKFLCLTLREENFDLNFHVNIIISLNKKKQLLPLIVQPFVLIKALCTLTDYPPQQPVVTVFYLSVN